MPPLEAKKELCRMTTAVRGVRRRRGKADVKLMHADVNKHLNAICEEKAWVELPEEFGRWGRYARMRRWLYGMRPAAQAWEEDYAAKMIGIGFARGLTALSSSAVRDRFADGRSSRYPELRRRSRRQRAGPRASP